MSRTAAAIVTLKSCSPFQFNRFGQVTKLEKEGPDDYERRTWRERAHYEPKTLAMFIPGMNFKRALDAAAKYLGMKIPGKRNATYTKHFLSGTMILENLPLATTRDECEGLWLHVPSDGVRGGGKRVMKCFPIVREWAGDLRIEILDPVLRPEVVRETLEEAGKFIGVGAFRPQNGGTFGRFIVEKFAWEE